MQNSADWDILDLNSNRREFVVKILSKKSIGKIFWDSFNESKPEKIDFNDNKLRMTMKIFKKKLRKRLSNFKILKWTENLIKLNNSYNCSKLYNLSIN